MSTIVLDPVAMDASAGAIGDHARAIETALSGVETSCCAQVPASLAGWLAEELHDIAVGGRMAALLYVVAALDMALRAQQLRTDQSLAMATPALDPAAASFAGPGMVGGMLLGASSTPSATAVSMPGLSTDAFLANNPLLGAASNLQSTNPGAAAQLMGLNSFLFESNSHMTSVWTNSRPGASYIGDGLYKGYDGGIGSINDVYRDPKRPGEYLVG